MYDRIVPHLLALVQDHARRIAQLETTNAELSQKLDALTGAGTKPV